MRTHKLFKVLVLGGAVLATGCGAKDPDPSGTTGGAASTTTGAATATSGGGVAGW